MPEEPRFPRGGTRNAGRQCFVRTRGDYHLVRLCLVSQTGVRILSGYNYKVGEQVELSMDWREWHEFSIERALAPLFDLRYAGLDLPVQINS